MNTNLLIFFAIPLAIIIFSIALQKILKNPFLVAGIIFSILLIIVLAFFDTIYLIAVVAYTILSFITALLTCLVCRFFRNQICNMICNNQECGNDNNGANLNNQVITVANDGNFGNVGIGRATTNCTCNYNNSTNGFSGMTGSYAGNYSEYCNRRR